MKTIPIMLLLLALPFSSPAQSWQELNDCKFVEQDFNDGDSFHVKYRGKEYIFRLYFVDTPEHFRRGGYHKRTDAQAKYFNVYKRDLYKIAEEATRFTEALLDDRFTVWTKWEDAKGNSRMPRYFAFVTTGSGEHLAEILVRKGFARIYGVSADPPFMNETRFEKRLKEAEDVAKKEKSGAWGFARQ